jgi:hypothetical protein
VKNFFIYHPGSGTMLMVNDEVYIIDPEKISEQELQDAQDGVWSHAAAYSVGWKLDNFNLETLFFGESK